MLQLIFGRQLCLIMAEVCAKFHVDWIWFGQVLVVPYFPRADSFVWFGQENWPSQFLKPAKLFSQDNFTGSHRKTWPDQFCCWRLRPRCVFCFPSASSAVLAFVQFLRCLWHLITCWQCVIFILAPIHPSPARSFTLNKKNSKNLDDRTKIYIDHKPQRAVRKGC